MTSTMPVTSPFRLRAAFALVFVTAVLASAACNDSDGETGELGKSACANPPTLIQGADCKSCTFSPTAQPATCKAPRTVNACCVWVAPPPRPLVRSTGLARYSGTDGTLNLACLDAGVAPDKPRTVALKGFVRVFSNGNDSKDVKIEIFRENDDGSIGDAIGVPVVTTANDTAKKEDLLAKCPDGGCTLRGYQYPVVPTPPTLPPEPVVPTETRLVVKTSDAVASGPTWATVYEYGVYFSNTDVVDNAIAFDPTAIAKVDMNTISAAAGGFANKQDKGMLVGEVHDCADVRLAGSTVDIDATHDGDIVYFGDNERNPLPSRAGSSTGTTKLGMFGALNVTTGVPIRVSAIGATNGQTVLLGTHTVQSFKGAVTTLRLRGRRPWQN
jgi:hypothetical protein